MIETTICSSADELADLREEWERLETPEGAYYTTHRFVSAWWQSYRHAPGYRLHVVVVRQEGQVVGIGPFAFRPEVREGRQVDVLRWASRGDYLSLLHAHGGSVAAPETITAHVLAELQRIVDDGEAASVHLPGIPSDSELAWHVRTSQRYHKHLRFLVESPVIDLRAPRVVPSHARKYRNRLLRERDVTFATFAGDEHGILDRIAAVHRAEKNHLVQERSRTERHSLYDDDRRVEHVRRVFTDTGDALTFAFLDGDAATGQVLAYRTVFRHGRRLLSWNSAYLPELEDYRMGKVLQLQILENLDVQGLGEEVDEFDLGAGSYPWKFEWTPRQRLTYRFLLRPPAPAKVQKSATTSAGSDGVTSGGGTATRSDQESRPSTARETPAAGKPAQPLWRRAVRRGVRAGIARLPDGAAESARRVARTRRLRREVVVWYVPHPDDESIFMGGAIAAERDRRHVVVLLTRGEASQAIRGVSARLGRELTVEEFVAARERECRAALGHLGADPDDVVRAELPDGGLTADSVLGVVRRQARRHRGASHRTMSYLDVHTDHSAAGRGLRRAHQLGVVEDARFYLPVPQQLDERATRVALDRRAVAAKTAAMGEYQLWAPEQGRYAVGWRSVSELLAYHRKTPHERVHGPELD